MSASTLEMGVLTVQNRETGETFCEVEVPCVFFEHVERIAAKEKRSEDDVFTDLLWQAIAAKTATA